MMRRLSAASALLALAVACGGGPSQVTFMSNERPSSAGAPQTTLTPAGAHQENPNGATADLGDDERIEPEHPAADTKPERALVHIHGPKDVVCSGVVVGPRTIATAQRCLRGEAKGASVVAADREYKVEVASSTLTWTNRKAKFALLPSCGESELDVGLLVLDEAVPAMVVPLKVVSAPDSGAKVQALGFGRCAGSPAAKDRAGPVRSRSSQSMVIDVSLCKGDVGGPIVDGRDGEVIGLVSHRDDPEGSPLRTTTIARLDTSAARDLIAQAKLLEGGTAPTTLPAVACR